MVYLYTTYCRYIISFPCFDTVATGWGWNIIEEISVKEGSGDVKMGFL